MNEQVTHILLIEDEQAHAKLVCRAIRFSGVTLYSV